MQLRAYSHPAPPVARMDTASAQLMFQHGLMQAQARVSNVWEAATLQRRDKAMQELDQWLQQLPALWNKTLLTCTPGDLVVYMEYHWLAQHAGTTLADGSTIASPSGVSQCFSNLSTGFKQIGRNGEWNPISSTGNPVESTLIANYCKGYKLEAWRAGYLEGSAVPMQLEKVTQLVDYLDQALADAQPGIPQLLIQRDIVLITLMWETALRGNNCGKLQWSDFSLPEGQPAPFPLPGPMQTGFSLVIRTNGTKTVKGQRSGPFTLTATDDRPHSCLPRLGQYLHLRFPAGQIATSQFLFSPQALDQSSFANRGMTASAINHRLTKHLQDAGLYEGESNHGFRRGQIQSMIAAGLERTAISQVTQIKTASVVDLYADLHRHVPRLERLFKRPASSV